jgi:hypothetical protein
MHLMVRPVWPADPDLWLTPQIIDITNALYRLYERVTGTRGALRAQVAAVLSHPGELVGGRPAGPNQQNIGTFTGKSLTKSLKKRSRRPGTGANCHPICRSLSWGKRGHRRVARSCGMGHHDGRGRKAPRQS